MNSMLKGGESMSYQSTLLITVKKIERKHKRKRKIKKIWNL